MKKKISIKRDPKRIVDISVPGKVKAGFKSPTTKSFIWVILVYIITMMFMLPIKMIW